MSLLAAGRTASATTASTSAQVPSSHSADDPVIRPMPLSDPPPSSARPVLNLLPREAPSLEGNIDFVPGFRVSFSEADQILVEYRTVMLLQFPFVPISSCTAHEMYEDQPLLLKTIVYTCRPQSWPLQEATDRWFREQFAIRIVILNEKSLELLQSLLVYIAW